MRALREIRKIIYELKKRLGIPITYYYPISSTEDVKTGSVVRTYGHFHVNKAIKMVAKQLRDFNYDLSFVAANKNFTYGGFFTTEQSILLIDAKDIPSNFTPDVNHHIEIEGARYEIQSIQMPAHKLAFEIVLKESKNAEAIGA